jgi:hypothetical protein
MQVDLHTLITEYLELNLQGFNYCSVYGNTVTINVFDTQQYTLELPLVNILIELPKLLDQLIEFYGSIQSSTSFNTTVEIILAYIRDSDANKITGLKEYKTKEHRQLVEHVLLNETDNYSTIPNCFLDSKLIQDGNRLYLQRDFNFNNQTKLTITNLRNGTFDVQYN